ncbi:hypothetical protein AMECASPLE_037696, partial [Ameca splendens]
MAENARRPGGVQHRANSPIFSKQVVQHIVPLIPGKDCQPIYLVGQRAHISHDDWIMGYDGDSSDSECESPTTEEQDGQSPSMPDFWLIVNIHQDRVKVYSHARSLSEEKEIGSEELGGKVEEHKQPEFLELHQTVVRKIGEVCRIVNQRMLLQDLHDSHVCNTLLVAESEEDIWKNDSVFRQRQNTTDDYNTEESYQAKDYLAATMQFIPGHFACDVVWSTVIHIHPRLKMGPNMGVSR